MNNPGQPIQNLGGGLFVALAPVRTPRPQLQQPAQNASALMGVAINALPAAASLAPATHGILPQSIGQASAAALPASQIPVAPRAQATNLHFQFDGGAVPVLPANKPFAPSMPPQSGATPPP